MSNLPYEELLARNRERSYLKNKFIKEKVGRNSYRKWTPEDDEIVLDDSLSAERKAEILGRSLYSIYARIRKLGRTERTNRRWTPEEVNLFYEGRTNSEISEITGRPMNSVCMKRSYLRKQGEDIPPSKAGHRFTPEDDELVESLPLIEAAEALGVSIESVKERRQVLRTDTTMENSGRRFSESDLSILRNQSISNRECAEILGRSYYSIARKRHKMRYEEELF